MWRQAAPAAQWTTTDELLATLIEVVDVGNRMFLQAYSKEGARMPKPIVIPRPGQVERPKPKATVEQMVRFFGRRR